MNKVLLSTTRQDTKDPCLFSQLTFTASSPHTDSFESSSENSLTRLRPISVDASLNEISSSCIATKISYTV